MTHWRLLPWRLYDLTLRIRVFRRLSVCLQSLNMAVELWVHDVRLGFRPLSRLLLYDCSSTSYHYSRLFHSSRHIPPCRLKIIRKNWNFHDHSKVAECFLIIAAYLFQRMQSVNCHFNRTDIMFFVQVSTVHSNYWTHPTSSPQWLILGFYTAATFLCGQKYCSTGPGPGMGKHSCFLGKLAIFGKKKISQRPSAVL